MGCRHHSLLITTLLILLETSPGARATLSISIAKMMSHCDHQGWMKPVMSMVPVFLHGNDLFISYSGVTVLDMNVM